ncbi:MAG: flagellar motor switch protein FliG, partial [Planctomycetes bacterium]|nr:flagellar motor switch protein FliG [Planctomycetota bacterium]
ANISERAAGMVEEETSLMAAPKKDDVRLAQDSILSNLRELNKNGELSFEE